MIPLYLLIGVWGGAGTARRDGQVRDLHDGGLAADARLGDRLRALSRARSTSSRRATSDSTWVFLGFLVAFAIKAPLFPLHGWLPDAYRESSPEVAAVLSGVISKAAVFGFIRICFVEVPGAVRRLARTSMLALAAIGLVYGSLLAFRAPGRPRRDRLLEPRADGADHDRRLRQGQHVGDQRRDPAGRQPRADLGLALPARRDDRAAHVDGSFDRLGGMARGRPALATMLMVTGIIALAVPGSSAFAGEFLILAGVFGTGWGWAVAGATGIVLAAMYMLRLISAVLHKEPGPAVPDVGARPAARRSSGSSSRSSPACSRCRPGPPRSAATSIGTTLSPATACAGSTRRVQRPAARGPDGLRHAADANR